MFLEFQKKLRFFVGSTIQPNLQSIQLPKKRLSINAMVPAGKSLTSKGSGHRTCHQCQVHPRSLTARP